MSKNVIFRDRQEIQAADLSNVGGFAQAALDTIVADAITEERRFTGFAVSQETATSVRVAVGRLYQAGRVYLAEQESVINLSQYLPLANKRKVALVSFGQDVDSDVEPRDFLIDLTTGETEPQAVPMLHVRQAQIAASGGVESVDPQLPAIAENACLFSVVTLATTGIASIEVFSPNLLNSVEGNSSDIANLKAFQSATEPKVEALTSQQAALNIKTNEKADLTSLLAMMLDIAALKDKAGLPANYTDYDTDFFKDATKIDTGLTGTGITATAKVDNGLMFPDAASGTFPLALFNPLDASVSRSPTDLVLPKYSEVAVLSTRGYSGDLSISQYQVQTHVLTAVTTYVYEYHYGWAWNYWDYWYYYRVNDGGHGGDGTGSN